MELQFIVSNQTNPYWNIAVENYLVEHAERVTLYLWKNRRTVVIGQNQNPYSEVNVEALEADGGYLMRRKTGGGAVYHDDGNLNFSFVVPKAIYDQQRQFNVIQRAVESFGLHTELSGRNDILAEGRKFSGNAFSKGRINDLHHGTILIKGNMEDLQRYVNLAELNAVITPESIAPRLRAAFEVEYGAVATEIPFDSIIQQPAVCALHDMFASNEWKYGRWRTFMAQRSAQFDWGGVELALTVDEARGIITDVQIASDALDLAALDEARRLLIGASTQQRPQTGSAVINDILSLVY